MLLRSLLVTFFTLTLITHAQAAPVYFGDKASFDAGTNSTLVEDFLGFADGSTNDFGNSFTSNGITYTRLTGTVGTQKLLVVENNPFFGPGGLTSHVLTDNNQDHWRMDFVSQTTAVGFDTYLNDVDGSGAFAAPEAIIQIFDTSNSLIDTFVHTHAANVVGFFGVLAGQEIGSIVWLTTGGNVENTGITNIVQGSSVPTPGALALLGLGLIGLGTARRAQS